MGKRNKGLLIVPRANNGEEGIKFPYRLVKNDHVKSYGFSTNTCESCQQTGLHGTCIIMQKSQESARKYSWDHLFNKFKVLFQTS